jgi:hypothetical protein
MRFFRALGLRFVIAAVVLVGMGGVWVVNSIQRNTARGDAQKTVSWFYDDARFTSFPSFLNTSKDYLDTQERANGQDLEAAFGSLDRNDFANEFEGDGTLIPDELSFKVSEIKQQDNNGTTAHILVSGKVVPMEMKRGKTRYTFADDTALPFTHMVTLTNQGGSWYIAQVDPQN